MSHRPSLLIACRATVFGALLVAGLVACGDAVVVTPPAPQAADASVVSLSRARIELITGYEPTTTVRATWSSGGSVGTAGGTPPALVWSSADTTVATVMPGQLPEVAVVTARRVGETTITVRTATGAARAEAHVVVSDPPPMPWPAVPPATASIAGLTVSAATAADLAPAGAPAGTVRFAVTATLTNATAAAVTVRAGSCPLSFSLHAGGLWFGRPGHPLVWDQLGQGRTCAAAGATPGEVLTLAPGSSRTLATTVLSTDVLGLTAGVFGMGGVLPNSTLAVHAHVRLAGGADVANATDSAAVVVDGGSMTVTLPTDRLAFRATVGTRGAAADTLAARVTLTNQAELPTYLEFGACAVRLLAYRTADRSGPPAWSSDARQPWEGTYGWGCLAYLAVRTVAAGADFSPDEFALTVPLVELLGDSLPDGRYFFTAKARLSNVATSAVDAGAADLALARGPMPAERTYALVTYRATSAPQGDTVVGAGAMRVGVTATLTHAGGSLVRYPADCVVRIAAYRTRDARDAAPRAGPPDWTQPTTGCAAGETTVTLNRGDSRTFAAQATAREILGASLPPGRYYFAAIVRAPGRLVYLAAGDAELAR